MMNNDADHRVATVRETLARCIAPEQLSLTRLAIEDDGVLVMEGEAANLAAKKHALRAAAVTSGAPGIADRLHVRPAQPMSDREIRTHLAELFALDDRFRDLAIYEDRNPSPLAEDESPVAGAGPTAAGRLSIDVRDGVVTLDGAMPSLTRMRLAGALAWRPPGVRDVINGLAVEPPEADGPDQLEEAVRAALEGDPLFDAGQIKVGVHDGFVRLTGLVHTPEARKEAEACAWRVLGVDEVINEIEVAPPAQRSPP